MSDAERARQAFLSHMRHELRTPVNAIIGYSEMLLEDAPKGPLRGDLERIHTAGKGLLALINDLLDPAKLEGAIDGTNISAFGAQMRQQLRTPVNAVIGYAEMLLEDETALGPEAAEDIRKIHAAGGKLLAFVDDIINLSKVASGNVDAALESSGLTALPAVADYLLNRKRRDIVELETRRSIAIEIEADAGLLPMESRIESFR